MTCFILAFQFFFFHTGLLLIKLVNGIKMEKEENNLFVFILVS